MRKCSSLMLMCFIGVSFGPLSGLLVSRRLALFGKDRGV